MTRAFLINAALVLGAGMAHAEPIAVEIVTATPSPASQTLFLTGEIVARDGIALSFPSGGRLIEIGPLAGELVSAGQVLARVDPVQFDSRLRAAEAGLTRAEADLAQARDESDRQARLLKQGASTRARADSAAATLDAAEAALAAARADLDTATKALEDTTLRAPIAGVITARRAEPGQVIAPAQPVLDMAADTGFDAFFEVPEAILARHDPAQSRIGLELIDIHAPPFAGTVTEISPRVDPLRGTVAVRAAIEGAPPGVVLGAAVRGFASVEGQPRITLPVWSLVALNSGPAVWVADPATMQVHRQPVKVLRYASDIVVIDKGLEPGTLVIGRGAQLMFEGRTVMDAAALPEDQP